MKQDKTFFYESPYQYGMDALVNLKGCAPKSTLEGSDNPLALYRRKVLEVVKLPTIKRGRRRR